MTQSKTYTGNQNQHLISKVYLKQFSHYIRDQPFVCVRKKGESWNRNKSIKSFLTETNTFDLSSDKPNIQRLYENDLNGQLENEYPSILKNIEFKNIVDDKSEAYLKQFISNLFCRSPFHRDIFKKSLSNELFRKNWTGIFIHMLKEDLISKEKNISFTEDSLKGFNEMLLTAKTKEVLNPMMMLYTMLFSRLIYPMDMVIIENTNSEMQWFTSDDPVILNRNSDNNDLRIINVDSEVYFPLSPKYLAYFHHSSSKLKNKLRLHKHREIIKADKDTINEITRNFIIPNTYNYLISPIKL